MMTSIKQQYKKIFLGILVLVFLVGLWHVFKPLPQGISVRGEAYPVATKDLTFLYDETFLDTHDQRVSQQQIFDTVFAMIDDAQEYILIDFFLFNDFGGDDAYRHLAQELTDHLLEKKKAQPDITIDFITDQINTMYGTRDTVQLQALKDAGVHIIYTNLSPLRDSNPLYSAWWRVFVQWFGVGHGGILPHPLSSQQQGVSLRAYLRLFNFKANHRKVVLTDTADGHFVSLITSANPHDGSAAHGNIAMQIHHSQFANDLYASELAVAQMSGETLAPLPQEIIAGDNNVGDDASVRLLTEGKIKEEILNVIHHATTGERIDIGMFYFSDRAIVRALKQTAQRQVIIRLILDPNKDAFGHKKNGIPNRHVAHELATKTDGAITVRWHQTHGEQFHTKIFLTTKNTGETIAILGSANYTRRNIGDYNLETDVMVVVPSESALAQQMHGFFLHLWQNEQMHAHTVDAAQYEDTALWKKLLYRIQEASGLSTF